MTEEYLDLGNEIIPLKLFYRIDCMCGRILYYPKSRFPNGVVKWNCSCGNYGTLKFKKRGEEP